MNSSPNSTGPSAPAMVPTTNPRPVDSAPSGNGLRDSPNPVSTVPAPRRSTDAPLKAVSEGHGPGTSVGRPPGAFLQDRSQLKNSTDKAWWRHRFGSHRGVSGA
ncbi:hypothetical protein GCM10022205_08980 [Spinactinospora alkalitolerans]